MKYFLNLSIAIILYTTQAYCAQQTPIEILSSTSTPGQGSPSSKPVPVTVDRGGNPVNFNRKNTNICCKCYPNACCPKGCVWVCCSCCNFTIPRPPATSAKPLAFHIYRS